MKNRTPVIEVINVPGWTQPSFNKIHLLTRLFLRVKSAFWRSKSFLKVFFFIKKLKPFSSQNSQIMILKYPIVPRVGL